VKRLAIISLLLSLVLCGCGGEAEPPMSVNITDAGTVYDGQEQFFYQVEDEPIVITVGVTKNSGEISVLITDENDSDKVYYSGSDIPTSEFEVTVSEKGGCRVLVTCDEFIGKYGIDYKVSTAPD